MPIFVLQSVTSLCADVFKAEGIKQKEEEHVFTYMRKREWG